MSEVKILSSCLVILHFRIKLEELNLTLSVKSEEITPPLNPSYISVAVFTQ